VPSDKITLLLKRIEHIYNLERQAFIRGEISTQSELLQRLAHGIARVYETERSPLFTIRPVEDAPNSADYNLSMNEIYTDVARVFDMLVELSASIPETFQQAEIDRGLLSDKLRALDEKLRMVSFSLSRPGTETFFRESFMDNENYDRDMVRGTPAAINTREAVLTLHRLDAAEYRDIDIKISSNGYPGDTHQVRTVGNAVKFTGEENPHINVNAIIDGNVDTWLEYEIYLVKEKIRQRLGEFGFTYREGASWLKDGPGVLALNVTLHLDEAKMVNWLSLSPFLAADRGAEAPYIRSIVVSDGKGLRQTITTDELFDTEHIYMFPRQLCKTISISIEQPAAYDTWAGHFYFVESVSNEDIFDETTERGRRVEGPRPSISALGLGYDPSTQSIIHPDTSLGYKPPQSYDALFALPIVANNITANIESIPAQRYCVGIRDITPASYKFAATSSYISKPFVSAYPMETIRLLSRDQVPEEFTGSNWLRYFISVDYGSTWLPISPSGREIPGTKQTYVINSGTPSELRRSEIGYIETKTPVTSVRVKIDLARPTNIQDVEYHSPIVYEYTLVVSEQRE